MKIAIIILNWNSENYIFDCIESVQKLEIGNWKIDVVIVDNKSTNQSDELIETRYKDVKLLRNKENLGFTGGNNVGIEHAMENGADYVMLLNSDTIVDKDLLIELIETAESDKQIGIVGPKIFFASGHEYKTDYQAKDKGKVIWYAGGKIDWKNVILSHRGVDEVDQGQYDQRQETDFVTGCCVLVKKQVIEKIGMLDNKYFLYLEDADFCQRAKLAGYKIIYSPKGNVWHLNAGSSSVGGGLQDYYITRNRLLFGMKYANLKTKTALLKEGIRLLLKGRPWQKIAVKDFFLANFNRGTYERTNN